MPSVRQIDLLIRNELAPLVGDDEARSFSLLIFHALRGYERKEMLLFADEKMTEAETISVSQIIGRLKQNEPIQYVLGQTEFMGLIFKTDRRALIPRPETEALVQWILDCFPNDDFNILDIGTGTGCIPVSIKKCRPGIQASAWDVSPEALELANENACENGVQVDFVLQNVLSALPAVTPMLDVMVSNPPYVTQKERPFMNANVIDYEPHLALFVEDDQPLVFYDVIAQLGLSYLKPGGSLFFEINENFSDATVGLLLGMGYCDVMLRKDIFGKNRMLKAIRPVGGNVVGDKSSTH
ncbi:peptide chain release factor N(5)-glutamine methyltransferase [Geofilum sp. OHC36d9]|uniref:peptide chain release factor N(5)-glutamine methyltransferase n=1 Tax=Geofilum sp. OHC36d9 TaxID=3458413 RepID=UPI004034BF54